MSPEFPSNLFRTLLSVSSQTKGVVPSAKLQIYVFVRKRRGHLKKY